MPNGELKLASNKKSRKNKTYKDSQSIKYKENVRTVMRGIWIRMLSHQTDPDLHTTSPFSTKRMQYETFNLRSKGNNSIHDRSKIMRAAKFNRHSKQVTDEALHRISTTPQPWPYVVVALQSDGDKVWYDHIIHVTKKDYNSSDKEYLKLIDEDRIKCIKNLNSKYVYALGVYIFNDRTIDMELMLDSIVDDMIDKGSLNKLKCLLGLQMNIKSTAPEYYESIKDEPFFNNLGELLIKYYSEK